MPNSVADELAKLLALRKSGVLTDGEFDQQKRRLLEESDGSAVPRVSTGTSKETVATKSFKNRCIFFGAVSALLIAIIAIAISGPGSSSKPTHVAQVSAFNSLLGTIKSDLGLCTAAASDVQLELGLLLNEGSSVSLSDLATLDGVSKNAQSACDEVDNNNILHLGTMSVSAQLSGLHSLQNVSSEANNWATNDTTAVLHDIQNIAETDGGSEVSLESKLEIDTAQADQDGDILNSQFKQAARRLGIKAPLSIGLMSWSSGGSTTTTTSPRSTFTTPPTPPIGTQPAFASNVPADLANALTSYFSNPSHSGAPIGEIEFSASANPQWPNWLLWKVQGKPAFVSNIQPDGGLAEEINGVWTLKGAGDFCTGLSPAPAAVRTFFRLPSC